MEKTVNKKKYMYYLVILIAVLILGTVTATYAFFQATTDSETIAKTTIIGKTDCIDIQFSTDSSRVGLNLDYPVTDDYALEHIKPLEVSIINKCSTDQNPVDYTLTLSTFAKSNVTEQEKPYMKDSQIRTKILKAVPYSTDSDYADLKTNTYLDELLVVNSEDGYNNKLLTDHFTELSDTHPEGFTNFNSEEYNTITNYVIDTASVASNSTNKYKIYLWVDYYEGDKNAYNEGAVHDSIYDNKTKNHQFESLVSLIVNNSEEGVEPPKVVDGYKDLYKDDTTLLGSKEEGNDGYLIYHDGTGTYGEYEAGDYSYRFAGNNPDNYVCLDGSNDATGECNDVKKLYRVIGWFPKDGDISQYQMKLIKSEYITAEELGGDLSTGKLSKTTSYNDYTPRADVNNAYGFHWSGDSSINYNNWIRSILNTTLNDEDGAYLTSLSAYINLIEETNWYIGGNTLNNILEQNNMKSAYDYELGENKLNTSSNDCVDDSRTYVKCTDALLYQKNKVGLMYATEYGYASLPSNWDKKLGNGGYNTIENRNSNWLYNGISEWTLSRNAYTTNIAFRVYSAGGEVNNSIVYSDKHGVRPVIVLKSNATIKSGEGSKDRPWRINLPIS